MTLARYVPRLLRERLASAGRRRSDGAPEIVHLAALWIDISGFTPLTRRFAEQGARGAEIVGDILDRCLGQLADRIASAGGDLIDFAGDAVLAVWPAADADALPEATMRAAACARGIQQTMDRFAAGDGAELRFYAGVGAGAVTLLEVGGAEGRWRFLVTGDPLVQMARAKERCAAGEVVLSPEALSLVAGRAAPSDVVIAEPPAGDDQELRAYLVDSVLRRLDAGQTDWLAEFRLASVVFVIVPVLEVQLAEGRRALHEAVRSTQERVNALGGSLNQVMMDDTGLVMLVAWGVPDHTHEDDARRAVQAAVEIRRTLGELGLVARVGVATGRVFCGSVGNSERARYALVGAAVNRAARVAMRSPESVRCDDRTRELAEPWLRFGDPEIETLKGIDEPVPLFRPIGTRRASSRVPGTAISGRERERELLSDALAGTVGGKGPPLLLIEGDPGIGKSVLLRNLAAEVTALGMQRRLFVGAADSVERNTSYFPWREPFRTLFAVDTAGDPAEQRQRVVESLRPLPGREERIPLLEPVLTLGFADNATTAAMAGADRGLATRELLAEALDLLGGPAPVLLLDDLHWFDSASLELIGAIRERVPRALIAGATRPPQEDAAPQLLALAADSDTVRIPLVEMSGTEILGMVRESLGVETLPEALADYLVARGEGHPLFTIELALLLREMGVVRVDGRGCAFDPDDPRLAALSFSEKAEGIVATRIDRLDPSHQLALKVASVVGRAFEFQLVQGVYPIAEDRGALRRILDDLTRPRLIEEERPDPALAYLFRHVVIREVAYGLVSYAQRRALHAEIARALEVTTEADHAGNYPLLAHHWRMAEEPGPAIAYLERAGVEALHRGAGREAFRFFQDAFALAERERARLPEITETRLAELERQTGEATEQLLDVPESSRWLRRALTRLGHEVPDSADRGRRRALLRQARVQLGHLLWPLSLRRRASPEQAAALELAARAYGTLAEHSYFESDLLGMLLFSLTSVNLAERAGAPAAAERSYVSLAHTVGLLGVTPLVRRYRDRSANTTLGRNMAFRDIELAGRLLAKGRMEEAAAAGERAALLARRYADRHHEAQGWGCIVSAAMRLGQPDRAAEAAARIVPTGRVDWAMAGQGGAWILSGRPEGALERFASLETWEPAFALAHLTARVIWAEERGEWDRARAEAEATLVEMEGPGLKNAFTTGHYGNLLAFHSRLYHRTPADDRAARNAVIACVRRLHAELKRHSRVFTIGRPRMQQAAAMIALHDGGRSAGRRQLAGGLRRAERQAMAVDIVGILLETARWELPGAAEGVARAARICRAQGMHRLLREVEAVRP